METEKFTKRLTITVVGAVVSALVGGYFVTQKVGGEVKQVIVQQTQPVINNQNHVSFGSGVSTLPVKSDNVSSQYSVSGIKDRSSVTKVSSYPEKKAEYDLVDFVLKGCYLSGSSMKMNFIIRNNDEDRRVGVDNIRIITMNGIEYKSYKVNIARANVPYAVMPTGIPMVMEVVFDDIKEGFDKIAILEIKGGTVKKYSSQFVVQMRDLPVY
jgi:hypothetical protein